jgi:hypothetical protein
MGGPILKVVEMKTTSKKIRLPALIKNPLRLLIKNAREKVSVFPKFSAVRRDPIN